MCFWFILGLGLHWAWAQNPIKWEVTLATTVNDYTGNLGGFSGATTKCSQDQSETWYPVLFTETGQLNPDITSMLTGKNDDQIIVRWATGVLAPIVAQYGSTIGITFQSDFLSTIQTVRGLPFPGTGIWKGGSLANCGQWTNGGRRPRGTAFTTTVVNNNCLPRYHILCMSPVRPFIGNPPEPFMRQLAVTTNVFLGNMAGYQVANIQCQIAAGEPGWTAVFTNLTGSGFSSLSTYPDRMQVTRFDWINGDPFLRYRSGEYLEGSIGFGLFDDPASSIPLTAPYRFDESPIVSPSGFWFATNPAENCNDWTSTAGQSTIAVFDPLTRQYTSTVQPCSSSAPLLCVSPPRVNTIQAPEYEIATSRNPTNGSFSSDYCPSSYSTLFTNSTYNWPFAENYNQPVSVFSVDGTLIGEPVEPSLILNSTLYAQNVTYPYPYGDFPTSNLTYWIGNGVFNCEEWSSDSAGVTGWTQGESYDEAACDRDFHVYCVREKRNRTTTPTPTPTPTPMTTGTITSTQTPTPTGITTGTYSSTPTPTSTGTFTSITTPTPTPTPTGTVLPTSTETPTPTSTPTASPTGTVFPTSTETPTPTIKPIEFGVTFSGLAAGAAGIFAVVIIFLSIGVL